MKKLIPLLMIVCLSGCAAVDAYLMGKYDNNEYQLITTIRYDAGLGAANCADTVASKASANALAYNTGLYALYESERSHNEDSIEASKALDTMAQELKKRYNSGENINALYCKLKFEGIEHSAGLIQSVQGKRPS
jgi:uncharacterized protein YceK